VSGFASALASAEPVSAPEPFPLRRPLPPAEPFPLAALGPVLGGAALAIMDRIQCPDAIAGQSVLGAASLAAQGHADVIIPATGHARPLSLFLVTVAASGERKSAADGEALAPLYEREEILREKHARAKPSYDNGKAAWEDARKKALQKTKGDHEAVRAALDAIGPPPVPPLSPMLLVREPTLGGLHKLFGEAGPSLGLFSDEAGSFLGGHGMSEDNRLQMGAGLSELWDGKPINRVRVGDGASILPGRRLAAHLMVQPGVADRLLSNVELTQQGLLSRMLVASPPSLAGTRMQRLADPGSKPAMAAYNDTLRRLLEAKLPTHDGALRLRRLELDYLAAQDWGTFADETERALGPGGAWESIRGLANKLPEHAARIAGVLELVADGEAELIGHRAMRQGIVLARFYASEALRLFQAGAIPSAIAQAELLLGWLHKEHAKPLVGIKHVYQRGPNSIRTKDKARSAIRALEEHGWLIAVEGGAEIDGERCRDAWRVIQPLSRLSQLSQGAA
jgi:hypothetical protein